MKNILNAPFVREMCETTANMYRLGWDERNGGNISYLLDEGEVAAYLDVRKVLREIPTGFDAKPLAGKYFIVTVTGKYFKNVEKDPETAKNLMRFIEEEEKLVDAILSSDLYRRIQELSTLIDDNALIRSLAKERDDLYEQAAKEVEEEKKRILLSRAKKKDDAIQEFEEVKEYNALYRRLKEILRKLTDSISEVIR